ncbi:MAG: biotin transporter BioY [Candidatus Limnocylindrales bacterium]
MFAQPRMLRVPPFQRGITLADFILPIRIGERTSVRQHHVALMLLGVAVIAISAQLVWRVPGSPVPITGQTFGVLATATALGFRRGIASVGMYLVLGLLLPIYAGGSSGMAHLVTVQDGHPVLGSTGGYMVGFLLAAAAVGRLAELGWDRRCTGSLAAMLLGNLLIYAVGLPWLAAADGLSTEQAIREGLYPFLLGDAIKLALAAAVFPIGWWIVGRRPSDR